MQVLHHVVMWSFVEGPEKEAQLAEARRLLQGCAALVPGTLRFTVGTAEAGLERSADLVLISAFADRAALDAYQAHPAHQPVKAWIGAHRRTREVLDFWGPL